MEFYKIKLSDIFKSMKKEGLVNDQFTFVYSLKKNVEDNFYTEMIPEFCCEVRRGLELLAQIVNDQALNYKLMKEYVYKVIGSSKSFGACRMTEALTDFERGIIAASKEECLKSLKRVQREFRNLEEKLHICLRIERSLILKAAELGITNM